MYYRKLILTNLPSFYKINLYNSINEHDRIFVIYTGLDAESRNADFFRGDMHFEHCYLTGGFFSKIMTLIRILRRVRYEEILLGGWDSVEAWIAAFLSARRKNSVVVESSIQESSTSGVKGFLKRCFISRTRKTYASGKLQAELVRKLGFRGEIVITKGVGIFNYISQPKYSARSEVRNFLFVGRLVPVKNLEYLIRKFSDYPELNLSIIGFGELESHLKSIASDNIRFLGAVDNKELPSYYQAADVFVLPSISEVWGLVVEEALNNGIPVMISDRVGCSGEIIDARYGVVFSLERDDFDEKLAEIRNIDRYNAMRKHISELDFAQVEQEQVKCYL